MRQVRLIVPVVVLLLLSACSFSLAADVTPPPGYQPAPETTQEPVAMSGPLYPLVPPNAADGEAIYVEKCAPCHGDSGKGDGPRAAQLPNPVSAIGSAEVARQSTPAEWYQIVTQGNLDRFMPPFSSLSDRQRWDVVAYAYGLSVSEAQMAQAEALYQENCASCHGVDGRGDGSQAAELTVQPKDFGDLEYMASKSAAGFYQAISSGVPQAMPAFAEQFSDAEIWGLSEYVRSFFFTGASQQTAAAELTPEAVQETPVAETTPAEDEVSDPDAVQNVSGVGQITGIVANASGSVIPEGLEITLHGFDEMQSAVTQTTSLEADGSFTFEEVEMPVGRVFMATVKYEGATYGSDIATVEEGTTKLALPIEVFPTTTDTSVLSVDRLHIFFEFVDETTLRIIELYIVSNTGEQTLVAEEEGLPSITFELPEGAQNLEFQDGALGGRYIQTPEGFGDSVAIRPGPGVYQVLFAFEMPYERGLDLAQKMTLPTSAVVVMVPEGNMQVKGDNLQDAGVRPVQGAQYRMYNGSSIPAGQELRLAISGSAGGGGLSLSAGSSSSLMIGLAVFGVVLIGAGVWLFQRNRSTDEDESLDALEIGVEDDELPEDSETVMDAILALDDLYKDGELPDEAYIQRREALKQRLKELL